MFSCFPVRPCAPAVAGVALLAICCAASAQDPFLEPASHGTDPFTGEPILEAPAKRAVPRRMSSDADVLAALDAPVTLDFQRAPLADVAAYLRETAKINVDIDTPHLEEIGVVRDAPVSLSVRDMRLKSALAHLLPQLELAYTVRDGALVISTPEALEEELLTRVYPVADLLADDPLLGDGIDIDWLIDNVTYMIDPTEWEDIGGPGSITPGPESLVVKHTLVVHTRVEAFLAALRKARKIAAKRVVHDLPITSVWATDGKDEVIRATLNKKVPLKFADTPLAEVADYLRQATGVNVLIDVRALEDVGIGEDSPITQDIQGNTLAAGLSLLLREMDLAWAIRDEALIITTPEEAESDLAVRIYPVPDLVQMLEADLLELDEEYSDYDTLIDIITCMVRPTSWEEVGGPSSVEAVGFGCLAISQTIDVFEEIDGFVEGYRQVRTQYRERPDGVITRAVAADEAPHGKLRAATSQEITAIVFRETPLSEVARTLSMRHDVPIQIDRRSLEDVGLAEDVLITGRLDAGPLGVGLRRVLRPFDLDWVLRDEVLLITTKHEAESALVVKFYPVRDLIEHADDLDDTAVAGRWDALHEAITSRVAPRSWETCGGLEMPSNQVLVVVQTQENHEALTALLATLRELQQQRQAHRDVVVRPLLNSQGEKLYLKNYELHDASTEETAQVVEMVLGLVESSTWDAEEGCSIRPSMTDATIIVRHTAATHRKIFRLLEELSLVGRGVGGGLGGLGGGFAQAPSSRIGSLALSAKHADNPLDGPVVLRIVNLDPEASTTAGQLADEVRGQSAEHQGKESPAVRIYPFRRSLVIRHTPAAQRRIYKMLSEKDVIWKPQGLGGGGFSAFGGVF